MPATTPACSGRSQWFRGQIDDVLTALRASSPTRAGSAAALDTLAQTLNAFDGA